MLASNPASILNQNPLDSGIPNRFSPDESDSKATPTTIIDKLNNEINAIVAEPDTRTRLVGLGVRPLSMTPAEFSKLIADDTEKWGKVIRSANIKTE